MTVATALRQGTDLLQSGGIDAPRLAAEVLLAFALRGERVALYAHSERELTQIEQLHFGRYLHERLKHKPTQYITGRQEFYGREFRVSPAALIPRPETELVVETALKLAGGARRILDVGTGSGCLAVTLAKELPEALMYASDVSMAALDLARENARRLEARVALFCADLAEPCRAATFDLIVSNPPYIATEELAGLPPEVSEYEPIQALAGGQGGVALYRPLFEGAAGALRPGGCLICELGNGSRPAVEALLGAPGWEPPQVEPDLAGIERVLAVRKKNVGTG